MPCSRVTFPDGSVAIVKHAKTRAPRCRFCSKGSSKLCDFEVAKTLAGVPITCDAPICGACARPAPNPNQDFCPKHSRKKEGP
jgi:hypothetical protein